MSNFDAFRFDVVAIAVAQPPLEELAARAKRRTRRRTGTGCAACVALAAVLAISMVTVGNNGRGGSPGADTPTADIVDMVPFDQHTVVAVEQNNCAVAFRLTTDGGQTWTPATGPKPWRDCELSKIPPTTYQVLGPRLYEAEVDGQRYLSRDAGETWQSWNPSAAPVDAFPPGSVIRDCDSGCGDEAFQFVDPNTGALRRLRSLPSLSQRWLMRQAPDGGLWVVGTNSAKGSTPQSPEISFSTDRGRTWHTTRVLPLESAVVIPVTGVQAYALGHRDNKTMLLWTKDGFETWAEQEIPDLSGVDSERHVLAGVVGANGTLLICGQSGPTGDLAVWVSADNGETFSTPAPMPPSDQRFIRTTAHAKLLWALDTTTTLHLTTDGHTWQTITPPTQ